MLRLADRLRRGGDPAYGWAIVATFGITETVSYGVLTYAFAILLVPMQQATGWSAAAIAGAYSLALLVSGLAGIRIGRLLDHRSPRLLMTAGSALAALLVLAWSRASNLVELYLVFAGIGVAMALVLYEPAFVVITRWFHVRQRAALTALTLIAAWASFIFSPLTERLVADYGWRDATARLALVLALITIPLHALVLRPAPHRNEPRTAPTAAGRRAVARRGAFWLIVASFSFSSFVSVATVVHLVALLIAGGITPAFAAFAAGLMGLAQIPGRILFALVGRRLDPATLAGAVFGLGAAALMLLALTHARWAVTVFVVCFGMSNGMTTLLKATLVADLYGRRSYGAMTGLIGSFSIAAEAAAPFAAALIALAPGGYTTMLAVLAAAAAAAAVIARHAVQLKRSTRTLTNPDEVQPAAV